MIRYGVISMDAVVKHTPERRRVAVDLTPMLPGNESGGAKLVSMTLVRHLAVLAPTWEFILLTYGRAYDDLAVLERHNVKRLLISSEPEDRPGFAAINVSAMPRSGQVLREIGADLLFCPLTGASVACPQLPVVSILYDLQHLAFPNFFTASERAVRDYQLRTAVRVADRIVCISEFTRTSLLEHMNVSDDRVLTIPIALAGTIDGLIQWTDTRILAELGVAPGRFLLFPANFWPHKNHRLLVAAFALYRAHHPTSDLTLICTGAPNALREDIRRAARLDGVAQWVRFPGIVTKSELATLLKASLAVIYPSFYEGFGIPCTEAAMNGIPVLSSNVAGLSEVAGHAALLFDPDRVVEMMCAIDRVDRDEELRTELAERGRAHAAALLRPEQMAQRFLDVLRSATSAHHLGSDCLYGIYADGWASEHISITYGPTSSDRHVDLILSAPAWLPFNELHAELVVPGSADVQRYTLRPQETIAIRQSLPRQGGLVEIEFDRVFDQYAYGQGVSRRVSGCIVQRCSIASGAEEIDLLAASRPAQ